MTSAANTRCVWNPTGEWWQQSCALRGAMGFFVSTTCVPLCKSCGRVVDTEIAIPPNTIVNFRFVMGCKWLYEVVLPGQEPLCGELPSQYTESPATLLQFVTRRIEEWNNNENTGGSMNKLAKEVHEWAHEKGFYPSQCQPPCTHQSGSVTATLMLVVTELAEAVEADRKGDRDNFEEEIADTIIRLLDVCGAQGTDIDTRVREKMNKNRSRPHKHGKKY